MATSEALINTLNRLLQLDHDAVEAYEQAIKRLDNAQCRAKLQGFQTDHRRHIDELKACITAYEGRPADHRDLKGYVMTGLTALQSMAGDEAALKAMQANEGGTNDAYEDAADDRRLPDEVQELVARNRNDEARHLEWLNRAIDQRYWEKSGTTIV
jgi:rubrerythrin